MFTKIKVWWMLHFFKKSLEKSPEMQALKKRMEACIERNKESNNETSWWRYVMKFKTIEQFLIGKEAKADHPVTCMNPTKTFIIVDVRVEETTPSYEVQGHKVFVRGENTMWFGYNTWELV